MALEKNTLARRTRRTTAVALALVATVAGVAVAFFITSQPFANNLAKGGNLTVDTDGTLPIDFTGGPNCHTATGTPTNEADGCDLLFPTNTTVSADGKTATPADSTAVLDGDFSITNGNPVDTSYVMWATCARCSDPTAPGYSPDELKQFNWLYVKITRAAAAYEPITVEPCVMSCPQDQVVYSGRLADMTANPKLNLGKIGDGDTQAFDVDLWLANDAANPQPQKVLSNWEFHVGATLPGA